MCNLRVMVTSETSRVKSLSLETKGQRSSEAHQGHRGRRGLSSGFRTEETQEPSRRSMRWDLDQEKDRDGKPAKSASGLQCLAQPPVPADVLGWGLLPGHLLAWEEPGQGPAIPAIPEGDNDFEVQQEEEKQWLRRVWAASLHLSRAPGGVLRGLGCLWGGGAGPGGLGLGVSGLVLGGRCRVRVPRARALTHQDRRVTRAWN